MKFFIVSIENGIVIERYNLWTLKFRLKSDVTGYYVTEGNKSVFNLPFSSLR